MKNNILKYGIVGLITYLGFKLINSQQQQKFVSDFGSANSKGLIQETELTPTSPSESKKEISIPSITIQAPTFKLDSETETIPLTEQTKKEKNLISTVSKQTYIQEEKHTPLSVYEETQKVAKKSFSPKYTSQIYETLTPLERSIISYKTGYQYNPWSKTFFR